LLDERKSGFKPDVPAGTRRKNAAKWEPIPV
jgi:hypothetical protein